jgi:hypothetical protein
MLPKDSYNLVVVHGLARSGNKSVLEKFCFPSLLIHAFWFASKPAAVAFVHAVTNGRRPASVFRAFLSSAGLKNSLES